MTRTKRKVPSHAWGVKETECKDGEYSFNRRTKRHMKKSTKKLMKLKGVDAWDIPNRDKMERRV